MQVGAIEPQVEIKKTDFIKSVETKNQDLFIMLLKHQKDVNVRRESNGNTAVMICAASGAFGALRMLIKARGDVNLQNNNGTTAAMMAAEAGNTRCLDVLLKAGTDITLKNNEGLTVADIAKSSGNSKFLSDINSVKPVVAANPEVEVAVIPEIEPEPEVVQARKPVMRF